MAETDSCMPGIQDRFLLGIFYIIIQSRLFKNAFIFSLHFLIRLWKFQPGKLSKYAVRKLQMVMNSLNQVLQEYNQHKI